jgi:hypothetical protein
MNTIANELKAQQISAKQEEHYRRMAQLTKDGIGDISRVGAAAVILSEGTSFLGKALASAANPRTIITSFTSASLVRPQGDLDQEYRREIILAALQRVLGLK